MARVFSAHGARFPRRQTHFHQSGCWTMTKPQEPELFWRSTDLEKSWVPVTVWRGRVRPVANGSSFSSRSVGTAERLHRVRSQKRESEQPDIGLPPTAA